MPNILLVEDDSFKSDEIRTVLGALDRPPSFVLATSVSSAIRAIKLGKYDLIVLDMALPSHAATAGGGAPLSLLTGGLEVLFELQSLDRRDPCVIVTQYPEIEICGAFFPLKDAPSAIEDNYGIEVVGCIEYTDTNQSWKASLTRHYLKVCES